MIKFTCGTEMRCPPHSIIYTGFIDGDNYKLSWVEPSSGEFIKDYEMSISSIQKGFGNGSYVLV